MLTLPGEPSIVSGTRILLPRAARQPPEETHADRRSDDSADGRIRRDQGHVRSGPQAQGRARGRERLRLLHRQPRRAAPGGVSPRALRNRRRRAARPRLRPAHRPPAGPPGALPPAAGRARHRRPARAGAHDGRRLGASQRHPAHARRPGGGDRDAGPLLPRLRKLRVSGGRPAGGRPDRRPLPPRPLGRRGRPYRAHPGRPDQLAQQPERRRLHRRRAAGPGPGPGGRQPAPRAAHLPGRGRALPAHHLRSAGPLGVRRVPAHGGDQLVFQGAEPGRERLGYLAVHPQAEDAGEILATAAAVNSMLVVNAPSLFQRLVVKVEGARVDIEPYRRRRT